jgi:hypothetical protein
MSIEGAGSSSGVENDTYRPYEIKFLNKHISNRGMIVSQKKNLICQVCQENNCEMQCYLPYDANLTLA